MARRGLAGTGSCEHHLVLGEAISLWLKAFVQSTWTIPGDPRREKFAAVWHQWVNLRFQVECLRQLGPPDFLSQRRRAAAMRLGGASCLPLARSQSARPLLAAYQKSWAVIEHYGGGAPLVWPKGTSSVPMVHVGAASKCSCQANTRIDMNPYDLFGHIEKDHFVDLTR